MYTFGQWIKAGHRSNLASLRFRVNAATERRKHTQVDFVWITQRFRKITVFPINSERLDAGVFTSMLPATGVEHSLLEQLTLVSNASIVLEDGDTHRSNCRRRVNAQTKRRQSQVNAGTRKRWHSARKRKRWNVRSSQWTQIRIVHFRCTTLGNLV